MSKDKNEWYINGLKKSDPEVIHTFIRDSLPILSSWIQKNSGSSSDVEGVIQEAMLRLYKKVRKADFGKADIYNYFIGIGKNVWLDELGRRKKKKDVTNEAYPIYNDTENNTPYTLVKEAEELKAIQSKIQQLGKLCSKFIELLLKRIDKQTDKQLAKQFNIDYDTFRQRKSRCLKNLRNLLN